MSKHNSIKRLQPVNQCIFCGDKNPTSEEHVTPAWVFRMLRNAGYNVHKNMLYSDRRMNGSIRHGRELQGDDATAPILCKRCNGNWGCTIQTNTSPILKPFVLGSWNSLSAKEISKVIRWYTCFLMVREFLHDNHETFNRMERQRFRSKKSIIPATLSIWISTISKPSIDDNHISMSNNNIYIPDMKSHIAVKALGHFVVVSWGKATIEEDINDPIIYRSLSRVLTEWGFIQILKFNNEQLDILENTKPIARKFPSALAFTDKLLEETGINQMLREPTEQNSSNFEFVKFEDVSYFKRNFSNN